MKQPTRVMYSRARLPVRVERIPTTIHPGGGDLSALAFTPYSPLHLPSSHRLVFPELPQGWGCADQEGIVARFAGGESGRVAWILRLVEIGAEREGQA